MTRRNTIEDVHGEIRANICCDDRIVRVSPNDGSVAGWIDLSNLSRLSKQDRDDV
ncbi:MAG: glutaminyl-peptide cyclotransferase [Syntrophaceae bacterium]|nr:glutaminyl-peptide cyclotransferase [Syntrophaceae bacterium]